MVVEYNAGSAGTGLHNNQINVYVSSDKFLDPGDVLLSSVNANLNVGAHFDNSFRPFFLDLINIPLGPQYLLVELDGSQQLTEVDENNNVAALPINFGDEFPDLQISGSFTQNGNQLNYCVQENIPTDGFQNPLAPVDHQAGLYLSSDVNLDANDIFIASETIYFGQFATSSNNACNVADLSQAAPGMYFVLAVADYLDAVGEENESNNVSEIGQVNLMGGTSVLPDPTISSTNITQTNVSNGVEVKLSCKILNQGNGNSVNTVVSIDVSTDPGGMNRIRDWGKFVTALQPNEKVGKKHRQVLPPGSYYAIYTIDPSDWITESDESNNEVIMPFTVGTTASRLGESMTMDLHLFPNPASESVQLSYELPEDESISIQLLDLNGRSVKNIQSTQPQFAGTHTHKISLDDLSGGLYILRLQTPTAQLNKRLIVR
ncbi:MAG: CARDB domain-containing protein [Bacteroidota bacterium]